jgi:arylformamidase
VEILDLTATVGPKTVTWPGTNPPSREWLSRVEDGDAATVSQWTLGAHTGTHMDARSHFEPGGWSMENLDLSRVVGPCRVVDLSRVEGHVSRADLEAAGVAGRQRVLLKTRNSRTGLMQREDFCEGYCGISLDAAEYLISAGVRTLGTDYLSVEPFEDSSFGTHHALMEADVVILEGLLLGHVEAGDYLLVCLPLKLEGSDGAPMRAVLLPYPVEDA